MSVQSDRWETVFTTNERPGEKTKKMCRHKNLIAAAVEIITHNKSLLTQFGGYIELSKTCDQTQHFFILPLYIYKHIEVAAQTNVLYRRI